MNDIRSKEIAELNKIPIVPIFHLQNPEEIYERIIHK